MWQTRRHLFVVMTIQLLVFTFICIDVVKQYQIQELFYGGKVSLLLPDLQTARKTLLLDGIANLADAQDVTVLAFVRTNSENGTIYTNNPTYFEEAFHHTVPPLTTERIAFLDDSMTYRAAPLRDMPDGSSILVVDVSQAQTGIDDFVQLIETTLRTNVGSVQASDRPILSPSPVNGLLLVLSIALLICYAVRALFHEARNIAIFQLEGVGTYAISRHVMKQVYVPLCCGLLVTIGCLYINLIVWQQQERYYFFFFTGISIVAAVMLAVGATCSFGCYFLCTRKKYVFVQRVMPYARAIIVLHYVVVVAAVGVAFLSLQQTLYASRDVARMWRQLPAWERTRMYATTQLQYTGEANEAVEAQTINYLYQLIERMEREQFPYFIIEANNYRHETAMEGAPYYYELNQLGAGDKETILLSPLGKSITISPSYLLHNDVLTGRDRERVFQALHDAPLAYHLLVPRSLQQFETLIRENYLKQFIFERQKVAMKGDASKANAGQGAEVHITYVPDGLQYYSYNGDIMAEAGYVITNPIVRLTTPWMPTSNLALYFSQSMFLVEAEQAWFSKLFPQGYRAIIVQNLYDSFVGAIMMRQREQVQLYVRMYLAGGILLMSLTLWLQALLLYRGKQLWHYWLQGRYPYALYAKISLAWNVLLVGGISLNNHALVRQHLLVYLFLFGLGQLWLTVIFGHAMRRTQKEENNATFRGDY